jgi:hypothetical protein
MGMSGISKSQVSRLCAEIDDNVRAFLARPTEGDYLWIDATYVKVRQNGRIVSVAAIIAVGVNGDGRREVLGMDIGPLTVAKYQALGTVALTAGDMVTLADTGTTLRRCQPPRLAVSRPPISTPSTGPDKSPTE